MFRERAPARAFTVAAATFAAIALLAGVPDTPVAAAPNAAGTPAPDVSATPSIPIVGALVRTGDALDAAARSRLPRSTVTATDRDGATRRYEGVRLADVLRDGGAPIGETVRGPAARAYVVISAPDGYAATFALGELDTAETRCAPLLVDRQGDATLGADGPVRVVAPCDRTHARWVRGVTKISVVVAAVGD